MSGAFLPYHLRSNKAIDRSVFMEFLIKLNSFRILSHYQYIGFGAAHMEDFKLVHSLLGISKLTCLEENENIYNRQIYNRPLSCIKLEHAKSGDYIEDFGFSKNTIMWLDYVTPNEIGEQLREFQTILGKLKEFDVVKITLNANPDSLGAKKVDNGKLESKVELAARRLQRLKGRLKEYFPLDAEQDDVIKRHEFSKLLYKSIRLSSQKAYKAVAENTFQPITAFCYSDSSHQMLTVTGIILKRKTLEKVLEDSGISKWEYFIGDSNYPEIIDMPDFTLRERLAIDSLLPCKNIKTVEKKLNKLNLKFDDDEEISLSQVTSYSKFYRHYPQFSKINL